MLDGTCRRTSKGHELPFPLQIDSQPPERMRRFGVIAALTGLDRLTTLDYTSHCAGPVRLVA
ncbi:protein of unknown function [Hyphomicrobium sp. MC1]|nr:protein of unknown function [Hyphomicrobium sp. MC1]